MTDDHDRPASKPAASSGQSSVEPRRNRRLSPNGVKERGPTARSKLSNNPLLRPEGVSAQSNAGRRWRDLASYYGKVLGPERLSREDIRAKLRNVIWLTLETEQLRTERLCGRPVSIHQVLHLSQELKALLGDLGLAEPSAPGSASSSVPLPTFPTLRNELAEEPAS
jgi:hypothetical protein